MWIFDATPLLYLATVDRLSLVTRLEGPCVLPKRVFEEVVETGLEAGSQDARRIERSVDAGQLDVVAVERTPLLSRLQTNTALSDADGAVLACADAHDGVAVMDETYGRDVAAVEGIQTRGTAYLVLKLAKQGAIGVEKARTVIDAMIDEGRYCAPAVYAKIVQQLDEFSEEKVWR